MKYYNHNLTIVKKCIIDFKAHNTIEEDFYKLKNYNRIDEITKNFLNICENTVNELTYTDIRIRTKENVWVCVNLDSLYSQNLRNDISTDDAKLLLPKTKDYKLASRIISNNITISTLYRSNDIVLYTNLKKIDYCAELKEYLKNKFIKGYLVCFKPELVLTLKNLIYRRKVYTYKPVVIKTINNITNVKSFLENKNYSTNLWINETILKDGSELLNSTFDPTKTLKILNNLNTQVMTFDLSVFSKFNKYAESENILSSAIITHNKLEGFLYKLNNKEDTQIYDESLKINTQEMINSAALFETIKKQFKRIEMENRLKFFLNYVLDNRCRIYVYNYPINYQLIHIVRLTINFNKKINDTYVNKVIDNFIKNKFINEYITVDKIYEILQKNKVEKKLKDLKINLKDFKINLKENCWVHILNKLAPKNIIGKDDRLNFSISIAKEFIEDDIILNLKKWTKFLNISKKKILYLIKNHHTLNKMINNDYSDIIWLDASSNAVQLITLRMGFDNEKLLMLTNIINNDTEHKNIYAFVTAEIKKTNHNEFLYEINNKLNNEELLELQDDEINKFKVMPGSYGMTMWGNRKSLEKQIMNTKKEKIWNKLSNKEKFKVIKYLWDRTFEILKTLGYDLEKYINECNSNTTQDWFNDYGVPIICRSYKKSKRNNLLNKLKVLKNKQIISDNTKSTEKLIEKIKNKIKNDERVYSKRTKIMVGDIKHTIRVPYDNQEYDTKKQNQSKAPNAIHSYDSANMFKAVEICKEIGINVMVIHDSIGCNNIFNPIVKLIFKIVNIHHIIQSSQKKMYPNEFPIIYKKEIIDRIIESDGFFN